MIEWESLGEILTQALEQALTFLPRALVGLGLLLAGWLLGKLAAGLTRRVAKRFRLDRLAVRSGMAEGLAEARIDQPPSSVLATIVFWVVFLLFAIVSLEALGLPALVEPLQGLLSFLPHVIAAGILLLIGFLIAQLAGQAVGTAALGMGIEFHNLLGKAVRATLLVLTFVVAVQQLGVDLSLVSDSLTNLITIVAAALALTFALGTREAVRNLLAGFYAKELYSPGDTLVIEGEVGTLEAIAPLNSEIQLPGERLVIPNSKLIEGLVRIRSKEE